MLKLKEKGFYRGVDLGGWLSQCDYSEERLNNFIKEEDFKKIASWGLDHVRLPIDYNILEDNNGGYIDEGFERVEKALLTAKKYGLNVVLDLHKTAGFSFDFGEKESGFFENEELQERFLNLWDKLAQSFGKYSDTVAFELLNEVTDRSYNDVWNNISLKCVERIRKYAPDTLIFIGGYWNNSPEAVKDLADPYDDKIVYVFHCYAPLKFTHQGAHWTREIDPEERYSFEDMKINADMFEYIFKTALEKAQKCGTDIYCGEYGVIDKATPKDVLEWYKVINGVFEKHGIARAAWCYKGMDFGITDSWLDDVRDELIKYL